VPTTPLTVTPSRQTEDETGRETGKPGGRRSALRLITWRGKRHRERTSTGARSQQGMELAQGPI
jgi:hypothetical protein